MKSVFEGAEQIKKAQPWGGKRFTLVSGCFDLLHVGHIHVLKYAASREELLVVAVLSDSYIRSYKGLGHPIINQYQRAHMVASVRFTDFVFISDTSPNSAKTLGLLKPNTVVYEDEVRGTQRFFRRQQAIKDASPSTKIDFLPRYTKEEVSTSHIIRRIREEQWDLQK